MLHSVHSKLRLAASEGVAYHLKTEDGKNRKVFVLGDGSGHVGMRKSHSRSLDSSIVTSEDNIRITNGQIARWTRDLTPNMSCAVFTYSCIIRINTSDCYWSLTRGHRKIHTPQSFLGSNHVIPGYGGSCCAQRRIPNIVSLFESCIHANRYKLASGVAISLSSNQHNQLRSIGSHNPEELIRRFLLATRDITPFAYPQIG
jgi:hypothetical protein